MKFKNPFKTKNPMKEMLEALKKEYPVAPEIENALLYGWGSELRESLIYLFYQVKDVNLTPETFKLVRGMTEMINPVILAPSYQKKHEEWIGPKPKPEYLK